MAKHVVLVVDDSEDDLSLYKTAVRDSGNDIDLRLIGDGGEAIRYLKGEEPYSDRVKYPMPRLILLDLKMPRVSGFDVLKIAQGLAHAPFIVVFTSSALPEDVKRAAELGATAFHTKPVQFSSLRDLVNNAITFFCLSASPNSRITEGRINFS